MHNFCNSHIVTPVKNNDTLIFLKNSIDLCMIPRWGDIDGSGVAPDGTCFLELKERASKTRDGTRADDFRHVRPRIFATGEILCPFAMYKK